MALLPDHLSNKPLARERLPSETLTQHQRERILIAATPVFAKRGFQQTTVESHIVPAAKISIGHFYQHFDNKEQCFLAAHDRILAAARERIAAGVAGGDGWAEQSYLGLAEMLAIAAESPLQARMALIEVQSAGPAALARYNALMDEVVTWLRRGREFNPDAAQLPASFEQAAVAGFAFFLAQRLLASEPLSVDSLLADTVQMVLEPITGSAQLRALRGGLAAAGT